MWRSLLCSTLSHDTITDYPLHGDTTNDSLLCSTLSRDTTTDYPIYRLSALICMAILQTTLCSALLCLAILCTTEYLQCLYNVWCQYNRLPALCYTCLYYNRLSALLCLASCLLILQPTIRSDMYSDTTNESLL
jgi:hypothetical protein